MVINPVVILALLSVTFNPRNDKVKESEANTEELALYRVLENIIQDSVNYNVHTEEEYTLRFEEDYSDTLPQDVDETDELYNDYAEVPTCLRNEEGVDFEYKKQAVDYWQSGKRKPLLSLTNVQSKYRKVTSERQLREWRLQVEAGGDRKTKLYAITTYVLEKVKEAIEGKMVLHDIDIKRWALVKKSEVKIPWFKASHRWIQLFKKKHHIVSRKITKFVTTSSIQKVKDQGQKKENFVNEVKNLIRVHGAQNVYNSDQSGFNLEIHSGCTLCYKGVKKVENIVQSVHSTTHGISYTIQPTISTEGKLMSPLYIVLKESKGQFGPRVVQTLFRPRNIYLEASASGKLSKELLQTWIENVFLVHSNNAPILLLDSWSGQCEKTVNEAIPNDRSVVLKTIPEGTTGQIQPLDVYGFRLWKNFIRKLSDITLLMDYDVNLHERNNIIKIQSLTHNQFSSPRFQNVFKYAWYKSGYLTEKPARFETPVDFSLHFKEEPICSVCGEIAIMRCGWCKKLLCFQHFFIDYHYCETYIQ